MICFNCPTCGSGYELDDSLAGSKVQCSDCNTKFFVPAPTVEVEEVVPVLVPTPVPAPAPAPAPVPVPASSGGAGSLASRLKGNGDDAISIRAPGRNRPKSPKRQQVSYGTDSGSKVRRSKPARKKRVAPARRVVTKPKKSSSAGVYIFLFILVGAGVAGYIFKDRFIPSKRNKAKNIVLHTNHDNANDKKSPGVKDKGIEKALPRFKKANPKTPIEKYGELSTKGSCIVDEDGKTVILRGMSFFHCADAEKYKNEECIKWLIKDWHCNIVRYPILPGVKGKYGFAGNPAETLKKLYKIIDACIRNGIYIIVDYHGGKNPMDHLDDAKKLFTSVAKKYGNTPNVIYEVFNEPYGAGVTWDDVIRPYFKAVITEIRKYDKDNIVLVGTPEFSLNIDKIIPNPLSEFKNIVYVAHFYAASHKKGNRDKIQRVIDAGYPVYISEFGTCLYTGDGTFDTVSVAEWMKFLDKNNIGWCNWSVHEKNETASILKFGARATGQWRLDELTPSGALIRKYLRGDLP